MKRKILIIISILVFLMFLYGSVTIIKLLTKEDIMDESKSNNNFEILDEETNNVIQEEEQNELKIAKTDNNEAQNIIQNEKEQKKSANENIKSYTQEEKNKNIISNNKNQQSISSAADIQKINNNNKQTQEIKEEKTKNENIIVSNVISEQEKKEENNASLANTTYRKTNTEVLPEIKKILEDEIRKDKELVDFGTTVVTTNKSNAYNNTTGFTYMFVNQIEKGKVEGNYVKFEQRVKNNVGAFGKYYIYAEDEFVYNSEGKNPKWSQTLVWIYVRF